MNLFLLWVYWTSVLDNSISCFELTNSNDYFFWDIFALLNLYQKHLHWKLMIFSPSYKAIYGLDCCSRLYFTQGARQHTGDSGLSYAANTREISSYEYQNYRVRFGETFTISYKQFLIHSLYANFLENFYHNIV